ncbi:hypothetical protein PIB30_033334 [Stylosanthes scabra]|uniref:Uncharacterized protein n=1 Tax=Stylosanthes scabra TaxID=79078 RepID=A0ABU6VCJ3_9FABA|nr:hypothetical protein [Stylosanthes scabra]
MSHDDNASDKVQSSSDSEKTRARPWSSDSKQALKRRRTSDVMLEMMSVMAADISRIADALAERNKTVWLEEVVEKIQNIPEFDDNLIIEACLPKAEPKPAPPSTNSHTPTVFSDEKYGDPPLLVVAFKPKSEVCTYKDVFNTQISSKV